MRIAGEWFVCTDAVTRPTVEGSVADAAGHQWQDRFLVDTGADRTVFTAALLASLGLPPSAPPGGLTFGGVGGKTGFVLVRTALTLYAEDGSPARIQGDFAAFIDPAAADMSILGRDILDHFDLIASRRRKEVILLAMNDQYRVEYIP
jgi:hypothetical protein